jgi:DNA-binding SARP family transcriptional activator
LVDVAVHLTETRLSTEVALLGPLAVAVEGRPIVVAGRRRRALLARLALEAPRAVSIDRLAEDLWEDDPAHRSVATLRTYVAKLRQLLPAGAEITSGPDGYALGLPAEAIDAHRFVGLVHAEPSDAAHAEQLLTAALALWRGGALEEFSHFDWARPEVAHLEETRLLAYERLFEAQLELGQHAAIVATLASLVQAHPLRERFHVLLATALYRSGRQAEALDAQRHGRSVLRNELGLEPGDELAELERRILEHDASLAAADVAAPAPSPARPGRLPVGLHTRRGDPDLVGRQAELDLLYERVDALDDTRDLRVVLISGEPGIGKTRLAASAGDRAYERGATVLYGACDEHLGVPYQPYVDALVEYARRAPLDGLASSLGDDPGAFALLAPTLAPHLPVGPALWASSDPQAEQHRLFEAVAGWWSALSATAPLVFVLDDMQWASRATITLTAFLSRHLRDSPVLIIATWRDTEGTADPALVSTIAAMQRDRVADSIELTGIDRDAVVALLEGEGAHSRSAAAVDSISRATGGNPFLITELVRAGPSTAEVPRSVHEVLLARIAALGEGANDFLSMAATAGLEFDFDDVAIAAGQSEDVALAALDTTMAAGIVTGAGAANRYAFRHGMLQRAVSDAQSEARRARAHRRLAESMERRVGELGPLATVAEVARHWRESARPYEQQACEWSQRAGDLAMQQRAYEEAAQQYELAAGITGDDAELRCRLLIEAAIAHARNGDAARGRAVLESAVPIARAIGDPVALARAALGTSAGGRGVSGWLADDVRVELLEEAYAGRLEEPALHIAVAGELALARYRPDERARRQALAREAVEEAEADGSDAAVVAALPASRVRWWRPSDTIDRLAFARRVEAIAIASGDIWLEADALDYIRADSHQLADRSGFDLVGQRVRDIANQVGGVLLPARAKVYDAHDAFLDGRLDEAEQYATEALAYWGDDPAPDAVLTFGYHIGLIRLEQGRHTEVRDIAVNASALWPDVVGLRPVIASQLAAVGDVDAARDELHRCLADDLVMVPRDSGWMPAMVFLADAAARLRDGDAIATIKAEFTPYAAQFVTMAGPDVSVGSVAHALACMAEALGDVDDARRWAAQACELERAFGDRPRLARSELLLARLGS